MGRRVDKLHKSQTLPSSPSRSFSSSSSSPSDFEFTISRSPRKASSSLCPADELFYKGQLLPLHLSPRISMVRTILLASSSTSSSSDSNTTGSRDSTGSSNDSHSSFTSDLVLPGDCDSSRPSSVAEDDEFKRLSNCSAIDHEYHLKRCANLNHQQIKKSKYFSLSRFSSVFKKLESKPRDPENASGSSAKKVSATAKEVIRKYLKKVKPLYEKLSQKQQQQQQKISEKVVMQVVSNSTVFSLFDNAEGSAKEKETTAESLRKESNRRVSHSFSENLRYPRRRTYVASCPSSMRSSPSHSGVLSRTAVAGTSKAGGMCYSDSSMEELQSAIQGAIAHCKNSMNKTMVSHEI